MTADDVRAHCLRQPGTTESRPFGPEVVVFKVAGKVFALLEDGAVPPAVSLKCEPELAVLLRDSYAAVVPGYHLNKRHWNTVVLDGEVPDAEVRDWLDDSYDLVVEGLPRALRKELREQR